MFPGSLSLDLTAKLFRGLSDPSRLALLEALRGGEMTVSQLVEATGLSQPNASAHLACLRDCGLVVSRQQGRYAYYAIADARTDRLLEEAEKILQAVADRIYACTRYDTRRSAGLTPGASDLVRAMPTVKTRPARPGKEE